MSSQRLTDSELFAQYFYFSLTDILNNQENTPTEKIINLFTAFQEILRDLAGREKHFFSNDFARLLFLIDKYSLSFSIASDIKQFYYMIKHKMEDSKTLLTENAVLECISLIADFISELSGIQTPRNLSDLQKNFEHTLFLHTKKNSIANRIKFLQVVVKSIDEENSIITVNPVDADNILDFRPDGIWSSLVNQCQAGSILNLINVVNNNSLITTHSSSIIVLEPDFLFDATEIAEAFEFNGFNPYALFLKRITVKSVSYQMILGNIINTIFDYLIINPLYEFDDIYYKALNENIISVFLVAVSNPQNKIKIKELARLQYENLKRFVATLKLESFAIEPTFISPVYGLQGRLDLLAEYHLSPNRKDIYELKSGNPAKLDQFFKKDGSIISTGVYVNHFAQVTVYNMLLDTCYPNRKGNSAIIYSKDGENPIRNVPNYYKMKQEIILARNQYLAFEQELLNNSNSFFDNEWERNFEHSPSWIKNDFNLLKNMFNNANSLISEYYTVQLKFVLDELYTMKLGENSHYSGFSEIWKESIKEKKLKSRIMMELTLVEEESDFDNLHLTFTFPADDNMNVSFRKGDIAILYPDDNNSEFTPQRGRLIKCSIKEITRNKLIVSIRNKLEHGYFASNNTKWILDFDNTDSLQKSILHSLSAFLTTNEEKQNILLGLTRPEFNFDEYDLPDYLSTEQKSILMRILNSQDYFLLQGPPGTGKTKYMLAALVETLINQTNDNILVLAYTNRAVDEICSALKSLNGIFNKPFDIVRLGRKDNTIHKDIVLSHIVENNDINLVYKELKKTRVFAATVATIVTNTQLLDFKYFHTAIIDEASQITEANLIGILAKVERFVLIGDEKQLPAIVLQSKKHKDAPSENMSKIHFILPETSLFERLLDCAKSNAWYDAFAMLTRQARMHADIMEFPAQYFYNNQLKIFDYDLQMSKIDWHFNMEDFLAKELNMHRFIFINTDIEVHSKYNIAEVNAVVDIIKTIIGKSDNKDDSIVGVISPFRLQCSLIQKKLPDNLNAIVTVDTVEKFQGSQREFIVISMALNNIYLLDKTQSSTIIDGQEIDRKLNVAITRAKSHVVILGNSQILSHSPVYSRLIEHCKSKNAFLDLDSLHLSYF